MGFRVKQAKAAFTISWYSLLAMLRSPTAIVFSILFPIIFIIVFGSIDVGKPQAMKLAVAAGSDTTGVVYNALSSVPNLTLVKGLSAAQQSEDLKKGRLTALINIIADGKNPVPHYIIQLKTGSSSGQQSSLLQTVINEAVSTIDHKVFPNNPSVAKLQVIKIPGRAYRSIDFILPGQLGFSLLMAGVYGSSFLLFSLRQNLVLKRLRATPVRRRSIIVGEMLSRLLFQIIAFVIMVALGCGLFQFTLVNGVATFFEMLAFSFFGLFIFIGIGFIISGVVHNENSIAPIANTVVLPQILLCGLFFPVTNYPHWMEKFCDILPLTLFVDGLRKIAFEGTHIWQLPTIVGGLVLWTLVIIPVSIKSFKWE